jgi:uncharacterized membrane protein
MSKEPAKLILASFEDERVADQALKDLKLDKRGRLIEFMNVAIVNRDEENKIHIKETADMGGGKGALYGGVVGAIVGLIAGPLGAAIGGVTGAAVGGITAKKIDAGIPDERLTEIAAALQPGTSVILAVVEQRWFEDVRMRLEEANGNVLSETLNDQFFEQVEAGREDS